MKAYSCSSSLPSFLLLCFLQYSHIPLRVLAYLICSLPFYFILFFLSSFIFICPLTVLFPVMFPFFLPSILSLIKALCGDNV